jgi:hypothetical protein
VGLAQLGRDDQVGDRLTQRLLTRVPEHRLGPVVPLHDASVGVDRHDRVQRRVDDAGDPAVLLASHGARVRHVDSSTLF